MTFAWDAATYDRLLLPHELWGAALMARVAPYPGDSVLEIGCGTGRDTLHLAEHVFPGPVYALDRSETMLELAKKKTGEHPNIYLRLHDVTQPLPQEIKDIDKVVSIASFHWILDHEVAFTNIRRVLHVGSVMELECGGLDNIHLVRQSIRRVLGQSYHEEFWNFASAQTDRRLLEGCGYEVIRASTVDDFTPEMDSPTLHSYLKTVVLGPFLSHIPTDDIDTFVSEVAKTLPSPRIDYRRLQLRAVAI